MWIPSPGQEDALGKKMAPHSSIRARKVPWTEEPEGYSPWGSQRSGLDLETKQQQHLIENISKDIKVIIKKKLEILEL